MKKALGIVLLVLALSLVSAPASAQQVELNLKCWHAGVGGADLWVADCGESEYSYEPWDEDYEVHQLNGYPVDGLFSEERLVLQFGIGKSFILSGSYFVSPTASVGVSYWGLSRADTVARVLDNDGARFEVEGSDDWGEYEKRGSEKRYMVGVPWLDGHYSYDSRYIEVQYSEDDYFGNNRKGLLAGEGGLSMSALDISGMKALTGPGWEMGVSGGIRKAALSQNQLTTFENFNEGWDTWLPYWDFEYGGKYSLGLDSTLSVSAIGPQVGIEGTYALADKLVLKAGAKAGLLFGTAQTDATWTVEYWGYSYGEAMNNSVDSYVALAQAEEGPYEWELRDSDKAVHKATDAIRIATYDLSAGLAYQITNQWSLEAGYYASIWKGVPSPYFFSYNKAWDWHWEEIEPNPISDITGEKSAWEQPEARTITVRGLTLGVNFKF